MNNEQEIVRSVFDAYGYHCEKYGHTRFPVYADFYCADFEKRGSENVPS